MKKYLFFLFIALCLVLMGCSSSKKADDVDDIIESLKLTVEVKDALNEEPVEGAMVMVEINGEITNKEIDENGQAIFILKPGNYQISAAKDNYISNGIKRIKLERDYEVIIEMGKEIEQIIENDTKIITNGLYELDFSEISDDDFTYLENKLVYIKKSVNTNDDINELIPGDSDGLNIVGNILSVTFQSNFIFYDCNTFAKIKYRIPYDIEDKEIQDYGLMMLVINEYDEREVIPCENSEFDNEFIISIFDMQLNNLDIKEITIFLYEKVSENIDDTPDVSTAIEFMEDVKKHGINLTEVGKEQAEIIKNNFYNGICSYISAVNRSFEEGQLALYILNRLVDIGPGVYEVDSDKMRGMYEYGRPEDYYKDEYAYEYEEYLLEHGLTEDDFDYDDYYWNVKSEYISFTHYSGEKSGFIVSYTPYDDDNKYCFEFEFGDYSVKIEPVSEEEFIVEEIKEEENRITEITYIDFTKFTYSFEMCSNTDPDFLWSFDFYWKIIDEASIKEYINRYTDENYNEYYDENGELIRELEYIEIYEDHHIYPEKAIMVISGKVSDSRMFSDDEGNPMSFVGEITLEGELDLFVTDENLITYNGKIESEEFDYDGYLEIDFKEKRSLEEIFDEKNLPLLNLIYFDGNFRTRDYELDGSCKISLLDQNVITNDREILASLPKYIWFDGRYYNLSENDVTLFGYIGLEIIYDNYTVDFSDETEGETEEDYLPFIVTLGGFLSQADYADSLLNFRAERKGYKKYDVEFEYHFPESRYIVGEAEITENIDVRVYNQNNLLLEFNNEYSGDKIGEIRNRNNENEIFGEISNVSGEPVVRFCDEDKTSFSILP